MLDFNLEPQSEHTYWINRIILTVQTTSKRTRLRDDTCYKMQLKSQRRWFNARVRNENNIFFMNKIRIDSRIWSTLQRENIHFVLQSLQFQKLVQKVKYKRCLQALHLYLEMNNSTYPYEGEVRIRCLRGCFHNCVYLIQLYLLRDFRRVYTNNELQMCMILFVH